MSIKRRFENQYHRIISSASNISIPSWMLNGVFRMSMIVLVAIAGVGYISKISTLATGGYQLRDLENQVATLNVDIQKTQVDIASNSSLTNIESRLSKIKMVQASDIKYFNVLTSEMAKR